MKLEQHSIIQTDCGLRTIIQLKKAIADSAALPMALTYDFATNTNKYVQITGLTEHTDCELYNVKFTDSYFAKVSSITCTRDTTILQYDVITTTIEPLIDRSFNVYNYIKANKNQLHLQWKSLGDLINYGTAMPNLISGDIIAKFIERKPVSKDLAYEVKLSDVATFAGYRTYAFTASASQTSLDASGVPNLDGLIILVNSLYVANTEYVIDSTLKTITFDTALSSGDSILLVETVPPTYTQGDFGIYVGDPITHSYNMILVK